MQTATRARIGSSNAALSEVPEEGRAAALARLLHGFRGPRASKLTERAPGCPRKLFPAVANLFERAHDEIECRGKFVHNVRNNLRFCARRQFL